MSKNRLFLDIHAIQTLPPSNINRDDTGSPKTALYGGVRRARVSSQSWKKAMRDYFKNEYGVENIGYRTVRLPELIAANIREENHSLSEEEAINKAMELLAKIKFKNKKTSKYEPVFKIKDEFKLSALYFISSFQLKELAKAALSNTDNSDELRKIIKDNLSIDIALFGRMLATDPYLNEDASAQVAHSISTHAIQNEFDYFTALDDFPTEDKTGAEMIDNVEFASSTLYRYANIALHELSGQLNDKNAVIDAVKLFIKAFANSLPTGKINSFANQTIPDVLIVTLRNDRPISLVTAFEKPVKSTDGNVIKSIQKLSSEFKKVEKFVNEPIATMYVSLENVDDLSRIGEEKASLNSLLEDISKTLFELI